MLRFPRDQIWQILDALQRLCDDPRLLALREENDQQFIVAAGSVRGLGAGDPAHDGPRGIGSRGRRLTGAEETEVALEL